VNSLKWKRRIAQIYQFSFQKNQSRDIILIYHAVGDGPWAISANNFKKQMQWLKANVDIVSLTTLLSTPAEKNKTRVAITFDDGYACLYDVVLPILQAEDVTAAVYINTGWMGNCEESRKDSNQNLGHYPGEKFLTWDEVRILSQNSWEIGSHGVDHINLTKQTEETIKQELILSKLTIENQIKKPCIHFAYTWGQHNELVRNNVCDAGYHHATAAHHGTISVNDDPCTLPRMNVAIEYMQTDFENMVKGHWDFLGHIHHWKKKLKMETVG